MNWRSSRKFLTVLVFSIFAAYRLYASGIHDFTGQCDLCHLNRPDGDKKLLFVRDMEVLCLGCHPGAKSSLSHPSGIKPSFPLPPEFPLDWRGRMTCMSCHRAHGKDKYLLIVTEKGKAFCMKCHRESILVGSGGHEVISSLLHQPRYEITEKKGQLDRESLECLSCHDGSFASLQEVSLGPGIWEHGPRVGISHPVGTDYRKAARKGGLRNVFMLDKRIRLFDGKIGCGSCHSLYSPLPAKLVMENRASNLCLSCHLK